MLPLAGCRHDSRDGYYVPKPPKETAEDDDE